MKDDDLAFIPRVHIISEKKNDENIDRRNCGNYKIIVYFKKPNYFNSVTIYLNNRNLDMNLFIHGTNGFL